MQVATFNLVRGDDQDVGVIVNQPDGTPYNLSGATLAFTARKTSWCSEVLFQKTVTGHFGAASGYSCIPFDAVDTVNLDDNQFFYDIKLISSGNKTTTLVSGPFSIFPK